MTSASASRRVPFWVLTLGSVGVTAYGLWSATNRLKNMEAVLLDGSATTSDVYAGQSWVSIDNALIIGGLVGLAVTLAVWTIGTRFGTPAAPVDAVAVRDDAPIYGAVAPIPVEDVRAAEPASVVATEESFDLADTSADDVIAPATRRSTVAAATSEGDTSAR